MKNFVLGKDISKEITKKDDKGTIEFKTRPDIEIVVLADKDFDEKKDLKENQKNFEKVYSDIAANIFIKNKVPVSIASPCDFAQNAKMDFNDLLKEKGAEETFKALEKRQRFSGKNLLMHSVAKWGILSPPKNDLSADVSYWRFNIKKSIKDIKENGKVFDPNFPRLSDDIKISRDFF